MKLLCCSSIITLLLCSINLYAQPKLPANIKNIPGIIKIREGQRSTVPNYVEFDPSQQIPITVLTRWMSQNFNLESNYQLSLKNRESDNLGFEHYRYKQTYKGYPIENSMLIAHTQKGFIHSINGDIYNTINTASIPVINESVALLKALQYCNALFYRWQDDAQEKALQVLTKNTSATYFPKGELVYTQIWNKEDGKFVLAYKFNIYAEQPLKHSNIYIDAINGQVVQEYNLLHTANTNGTANTKYSGTQSIITDSYTGGYRLRETGRGNGVAINTFNCQKGTNFTNIDFSDADNVWNNINANQDEAATDAHWGAEKTFDYYNLVHNRNSINGNGMTINSYVHYGNNYFNAFWDGNVMAYGDGSGSASALTALDIAGHEMTHGVTQYTAGLNYQNEPGAINESFSDIFGTIIEFYAKPNTANWTVGENIGSTLRSMSNPNAYSQPDTYMGTNWYTGSADNGGVHYNSGVGNFWFYLLCQGGTGTNDINKTYTVTGQTIAKARLIAYRTLSVYLTPSSKYADARFYSIQAATDIYGGCSPEVIATTNAWYAVGVGNVYNSAVISNFSANVTSACSVPQTIIFQNSSVNGSNFIWDFGDGSTSTAINPTHTYTTLGNYTVSLSASATACGSDSEIKSNYISILNSNPCIYNMVTNGTAGIQTACSGTLYDSGGSAANYADNSTTTFTIAPPNASQVSISFSQFDTEPDYDYVYVYDGPNDNAPNLGYFSGNTLPNSGNPIIANSGVITIKLVSDPYVTGQGFKLSWVCTSVSAQPVANFSSNIQSTCSGAIKFYDLSTNAPTAWEWDFGDNQTSTLKNPIHTYTNNGNYTVKLKASNSYGSNTINKVSYITVNRPTMPTTVSGTACSGNSITLSASASGVLKWFDQNTDGNLLNIGSTYTTPALTNTTNYYVENTTSETIQNVGPSNNIIGSGANFTTSNRYLIFDVYTPVKLLSVKVYANGGLTRTIQLRNSAGIVLQDTTLYINDGESRINLNFDLPIGSNLQLGTAATANLYRNSVGAVFPYTLPGILSITGTNATAGYYYFFYDWQVQQELCRSPRAVATATINNTPPNAVITYTGSNVICQGDSLLLNTNAGVGYTYQWKLNGVNINEAKNSFFYAKQTGNYSVAVSQNSCSSITATAILVTVNAKPSVSLAAQGNTSICEGSSVNLVASASPGCTYEWYYNNNLITGATSTIYAANQNGVYTVKALKNTCSSISTPVNITVYQQPDATITLSNSLQLCPNDSVILSVPNIAGYTYQWSNSISNINTASGNTLTVYTPETYKVQITNGACIKNSALQTVVLKPLADATISVLGASGICEGDSTLLSVPATVNATYTWLLNDTPILNAHTNIFNAKAAGTYQVISSLNACNNAGNTANIIVNSLATAQISSTGSLSICTRDSVLLNNTLTEANVNYQWYLNNQPLQNATTTNYYAKNEGSYLLVAQNSNCTSSSNTLIVTTTPTPNPVIIGNIFDCPNSLSTYTIENYNPNNIYVWQVNGGTIISGQGTSTVQILWDSNLGNAYINVTESLP